MFRSSHGAAAVALLCLSACLAPAQTMRTTPEIESSPFESSISVSGITERVNAPDVHQFSTFFLLSMIGKKAPHVTTHTLTVFLYYQDDWRVYYRAADDNAESLDVQQIGQKVISCVGKCLLSEGFSIDITEATLKAHPLGFAVKVYAKNGHSLILQVSQAQIREQLSAVARATPKD